MSYLCYGGLVLVSLRLSDDLIERVDVLRGEVPRGTWMRLRLEEVVGLVEADVGAGAREAGATVRVVSSGRGRTSGLKPASMVTVQQPSEERDLIRPASPAPILVSGRVVDQAAADRQARMNKAKGL